MRQDPLEYTKETSCPICIHTGRRCPTGQMYADREDGPISMLFRSVGVDNCQQWKSMHGTGLPRCRVLKEPYIETLHRGEPTQETTI